MKTKLTLILIATNVCLICLVSCHSNEDSQYHAMEPVSNEIVSKNSILRNNEKTVKKDSLVTPKKVVRIVKKTEQVQQKGDIDSWGSFRMETEMKIEANEKNIKMMQETPNASAKMIRKLKRLQKDNDNLKKKITEYDEEMKIAREKFKDKINQDVNNIDNELKDLTVNSKK